MNWKLETASPQVHRLSFTGVASGWSQRVLLMSDEHVDNAKCDRTLLKRHHEEAAGSGAPVMKFGDTFCAMQGKWDKRSDQNQLREEHRGNNYLDRLVDTTADFYAPFAKNIALMTDGNHESSIQLRHETSLLDRVIEQLGAKGGAKPQKGSYMGFVQFYFGKHWGSVLLNWHHGYGGGGEVTRGMIDNNRTRGMIEADIFYSGHIHRRNMDENIVLSVTDRLQMRERRQIFLRGSSDKDEHVGGNGWHIGQGRAARPKGGWWVEFKARREKDNHVVEIIPTPAT